MVYEHEQTLIILSLIIETIIINHFFVKEMNFILFKKSTGIGSKFKVLIVEKEENICAPPSINLMSHH